MWTSSQFICLPPTRVRFWKHNLIIFSFLQRLPLCLQDEFQIPSNGLSKLVPVFQPPPQSLPPSIPYVQVTHHGAPTHVGSFHSKSLCSLKGSLPQIPAPQYSPEKCWTSLYNSTSRWNIRKGKVFTSPFCLSIHTHPLSYLTQHFLRALMCLFLQTVSYISDSSIG